MARRYRTAVLTALSLLAAWSIPAECGAGWSIGIGIGGPICCRPWCGFGYYYRPYYPVYVAPPPVIVQPVPVYQPVYQAVPPPPAPPPAPAPVVAAASPAAGPAQTDVDRYVQLLRDPDDRVRAESVLQLGRMKAQGTVDALASTLAADRSPAVRESAARALGLMGSPRALPALERAAQADPDRDVRHSARFAIDVVQSQNGRY